MKGTPLLHFDKIALGGPALLVVASIAACDHERSAPFSPTVATGIPSVTLRSGDQRAFARARFYMDFGCRDDVGVEEIQRIDQPRVDGGGDNIYPVYIAKGCGHSARYACGDWCVREPIDGQQ